MSRFDYVPWDETSATQQQSLRKTAEQLETLIDSLSNGRAKSLALTALEECYMWCGKAIRDEQIGRNQK